MAYEPQVISTISKSLTSATSTNILNVTESGILDAIAIQVSAQLLGVNTTTIDCTIDGGTTRSIKLYTGQTTFDPGIIPFANPAGTLNNAVQAVTTMSAPGLYIGDSIILPFATPYRVSLQVAINVTSGGSGGTINASVLRSKLITQLKKFSFQLVSSTDHITPKTGASPVVKVSIDGGAFATATNSPATEVSNGTYYIDLATADLAGGVINFQATATGADQFNTAIVPLLL